MLFDLPIFAENSKKIYEYVAFFKVFCEYIEPVTKKRDCHTER